MTTQTTATPIAAAPATKPAAAGKPAAKVSAPAKTRQVATPVAKSTEPKAPAVGKKTAVRKTPAAVKTVAVAPSAKAKKIKMVRDSFTIPKPEFAVLDELKLRAAKLSVPVKKTELIRAGIKALAAMGDANFLATLRAVPNLKTGRPAKD